MIRNINILFVTLLFVAGCKEIYNPHVQSPETGYLVVEGFINTNGVTTMQLTRSTKLVDTANIIYERNARLFIEDENNTTYPLSESDSGKYHSAPLLLNNSVKYRLHITTEDGKEYLSDLTSAATTPPVDSISWLRDADGVHFYVNAQDNVKGTKYYKWDYTETWEFHSAFSNSLKWTYNPATGKLDSISGGNEVDTAIYKCWNTINSSNILIGSTDKLSTNKIYLLLHSVEAASVKLSVLYSIIIRQHALTQDAYSFYEKLKKNTEGVGSTFDAQPSDVTGNIHCITDASQPVIGYIVANNEQQKRIFIAKNDVPGWDYVAPCIELPLANVKDSIQKYGVGFLPTVPKKYRGRDILVFGIAAPECVDCTITGTNKRPVFWP